MQYFVTSIRQLYINNKVLMYLIHTAEVQHHVSSFIVILFDPFSYIPNTISKT